MNEAIEKLNYEGLLAALNGPEPHRFTPPLCPKCGRLCRTFWSAKDGWADAPWSFCCDVRLPDA